MQQWPKSTKSTGKGQYCTKAIKYSKTLGERYKLPQRVRAEPGRQTLSGALSAYLGTFWQAFSSNLSLVKLQLLTPPHFFRFFLSEMVKPMDRPIVGESEVTTNVTCSGAPNRAPVRFSPLPSHLSYSALNPATTSEAPLSVTDFCTNRKRVCDFLLVNNANLHHISHRFQVIAD